MTIQSKTLRENLETYIAWLRAETKAAEAEAQASAELTEKHRGRASSLNVVATGLQDLLDHTP